MAFASDGLIEGFYDPDVHHPEAGKFIMGLQFHLERMRKANSDEFDYPGCTAAYKEFAKAVVAYQKKLSCATKVPKSLKLDKELEQNRNDIVRTFCLERNLYVGGHNICHLQKSDLKLRVEFLASDITLSLQQENRLMQMEATVRNASSYMEKLKLNAKREKLARVVMGKMSIEQLSDLNMFDHLTSQICSDILEKKQLQNVSTEFL